MNFSICLTLKDTLICNCLRNTNNSNIEVTSTSQTIELQNGYTLNVVAVSENSVTILIQNGTQVIIRTIYTNYNMNINIPTGNPCNSRQVLCIGVNNIQI